MESPGIPVRFTRIVHGSQGSFNEFECRTEAIDLTVRLGQASLSSNWDVWTMGTADIDRMLLKA